jgi:GDPmannose 4,6-dehydratase
MTRALVIGISGQDGAYLAKFLLDKGYEVHGSSRDHETASLKNLVRVGVRDAVKMHSVSLADFRSVLATLQQVQPDEIYNLAGQTSVGLSFTYPVETFESISVGTINLLECLRLLKSRAKLYNAGSSECFGNTGDPATEETCFRPRSPYATAKAAAHHSVANYREGYGLYACTGILFNHESPLRPTRFVTQKIVAAACRIAAGSAEKLQLGNLAVARDWGWAPDYVDAMWRMLQQETPEDYVIATGTCHTLLQFTEAVFAALGLDYREHVVSDATLYRPTDIDRSVGNATKANRQLGWKANTAFQELIVRLVQACQ